MTELTIADGTEILSLSTSSSSSPFSNCPLETLYLGRDITYSYKSGSTTYYNSPFKGKTSLASLTIGDSVTSIGIDGFRNCSGLTSVKIGNNVISIGQSAFWGCSGLTSLTIPSSVTSIGQAAFKDCSGLTSVTLPDRITSISPSIFEGCSGLTSIIIGNNVTSIGNKSFNGCSNLASMTIPQSVTSIDSNVFTGCSNLESVALYCKNIGSWFSGLNNIKEVVMGDSVISIGNHAFSGCSGLTSVTIPDNVTSIGSNAFNGCSNLSSLTIGESVTSIGSNAFNGCGKLTSLTIGKSLISIGSDAFKGCNGITALTIADKLSVKSMASVPPLLKYGLKCATLEVPYGTTCDYALAENWSDMENIFSLHDGKKFVPALLIVDGENFISLNDSTGKGIEIEAGGSIVASVIDKGLLQKGFAMKSSLDITNDLIKKNYYEYKASLAHKKNHVYSYAYDKGHTYIISVTKEGSLIDLVGTSNVDDVYNLVVSGKLNGTDILAIRKMANLHLLNMENAEIVDGGQSYYHDYITSKNSIGDYFFKDKESLVNIVLPNTVTLIKQSAFDGCVNLRSMNIPPSVTNIAYDVFRNCVSLQSFCIEDGKHPLSFESYSTKPFADSPLENLYMGRDITYNTYSYSPFRGQSSLLSLIVGDNVTYIGGSAFFNCSNMVSLVIGSGVKSIGDNAFYNCESLPSVIIPNSVTSLGESAFYGCSQLAYVSIGDGVSTIASSVFRGDKSLEYLIIGKNVTSIGQTAFADGTNIQVVKSLNTTPPVITASTFNETTEKNATLNVPTGYKTIYWLHPYWEDFANIEEIEVPEDISEKQSEALATYNDAMGTCWMN